MFSNLELSEQMLKCPNDMDTFGKSILVANLIADIIDPIGLRGKCHLFRDVEDPRCLAQVPSLELRKAERLSGAIFFFFLSVIEYCWAKDRDAAYSSSNKVLDCVRQLSADDDQESYVLELFVKAPCDGM